MSQQIQKVKFYSLHWKNVDPLLVKIQKDIFNFFSIDIEQQLHDKLRHSIWIDNLFTSAEDDDLIITIVDIDCFPLNKEIIDKAISVAEQGGIFGCAQTANHLQPDFIYAAPMFLSMKVKTWKEIGSPSFQEREYFDVAGYITFAANQKNTPIHMNYPSTAAINKWPLSNVSTFGIFTIYEDSILHLFESRLASLNNTLLLLRNELIEDYNNFDYKKFIVKAANEYCSAIANGNIPSYKRQSISKKLKKFFRKSK